MIAEVRPVRILSAEPHLDDVVELPVLIDLLRGNVAVVIHQRLSGRVLRVEVLRSLGIQKKILVHKCFHFGLFSSLYVCLYCISCYYYTAFCFSQDNPEVMNTEDLPLLSSLIYRVTPCLKMAMS